MAGEKTKESTFSQESVKGRYVWANGQDQTRAGACTTGPRWKVSRDLCTRFLMLLSRKVVCFCQVTAYNTWATAKIFVKRRDGATPRVFLALRGGPGEGLPESSHNQNIVVRSQKETVDNAISSMLHPTGKNTCKHIADDMGSGGPGEHNHPHWT